jgi:alpha-1,6-mannosyltransferase
VSAVAERFPLRLVRPPALRVVDVAVFYGERSGGIRTYLDAKVAYAERTGAFDHRLVVPGMLPSVKVAPNNGYRWPLGTRPLIELLSAFAPDVVLLHDPFWAPKAVVSAARRIGARVVMVHHGSLDLDSAALPGPTRLYRASLGVWLKSVYGHVDAVMSACDPLEDTGREATLPLRFGLDEAFFPRGPYERGEHVLYAGRMSREKGVFTLLEAAARSAEPWPLRLMGTGTAEHAIAARIRKLGLKDRVTLVPHETDRERLAAAYRQARCVVMPGEYETFGLVAFEAAASGAAVVACETAPSARVIGRLGHTFAPGDIDGLANAIERARSSEPNRLAAARFATAHRWETAFAAELADLETLVAA